MKFFTSVAFVVASCAVPTFSSSSIRGASNDVEEDGMFWAEYPDLAQTFHEAAQNSYWRTTLDRKLAIGGTKVGGRDLALSDSCRDTTKDIYGAIEDEVQALFGDGAGCGPEVDIKIFSPTEATIDHTTCSGEVLTNYLKNCTESGGANVLFDLEATCDVSVFKAKFSGNDLNICVSQTNCTADEVQDIAASDADALMAHFKDDLKDAFGIPFELDCTVTSVVPTDNAAIDAAFATITIDVSATNNTNTTIDVSATNSTNTTDDRGGRCCCV